MAYKKIDRSLYSVWANMKTRCYNPRTDRYYHYGGRGIKVCERWHSYKNFYEDMYPRPTPFHQIDRIDNDGDYFPGNCRWVSAEVNSRNRRMRSDNKLGVKGVEPRPNGKFVARITVSKRRKNLGTFNTATEARTARLEAEHKYFS